MKLSDVLDSFEKYIKYVELYGDFRNGVTDSMGTVDEGVILYSRFRDEMLDLIKEARK